MTRQSIVLAALAHRGEHDAMNQALLPFYRSQGTDARGRTIETVWAFDDLALESVHDYIQWLFPTRKASAFNDAAPQLTDADVAAFRGSPDLQERLRRSLDIMLRFYGLRLVTVGRAVRIEASEDLARRGPRWWGAGNHNQLRLTRIIDSLVTLGLGDEATALYDRLAAVRQDHATGISDETMRYWRSAAHLDR